MLEMLDEEDRAMLILKYAEGYDYEELAAIFELSVSACKMRLSRAREKIQQRYPRTPKSTQPCPMIFSINSPAWKWRKRRRSSTAGCTSG